MDVYDAIAAIQERSLRGYASQLLFRAEVAARGYVPSTPEWNLSLDHVLTVPTPRCNTGQDRSHLHLSLDGAVRSGLVPTPRASDWRSGKASEATAARNSRPLCENVARHLNPEWVTWLMGFPPGWLEVP